MLEPNTDAEVLGAIVGDAPAIERQFRIAAHAVQNVHDALVLIGHVPTEFFFFELADVPMSAKLSIC